MCYCDDFLIMAVQRLTTPAAEHLLKLTVVLDALQEHDLLIKGSKSEMFLSQVEFLGFNVSVKGWSPTESKVSAVVD